MQKLLKTIRQHVHEPLVLVRVLACEGSTPLDTGSKMLVTAKGRVYGTVGGGLGEAECLEAAALCLKTRQPAMLHINMAGSADTALICGGQSVVSVEYLGPFPHVSIQKTRAFYTKLGQKLGCFFPTSGNVANLGNAAPKAPRETCITLHPFSFPGLPVLLTPSSQYEAPYEAHYGALTKEEQEAAIQYTGPNPSVFPLNGQTYIREIWQPAPRLIICGGGHVGAATCKAAILADFEVILLDDRPEYCQKKDFPGILGTWYVPDYKNCFHNLQIDTRTGIIILSRGHHADETILRQALATPAGYTGMIGSKRKRAMVYEKMEHVSPALLQTVHCPIGLPIQAKSPGEIAISIVAECVEWKAKKLS